MKNKILILSLFIFLLLGGVAQAAHYVLGYSSVDEGEVRWGGSTVYTTQWNAAISTWNALNKIYIAPDTIWTYEDLTLSDVNRSDVVWAGKYGYYWIGSDSLQLNSYYLNSYSSARKQNVATHELGHSLGLNESITGNVMYPYVTPQTTLGNQDVSDYRYLWGY